MATIARVVVDISLDREFDYLVPERLRDGVKLGIRVLVPFGRTRRTGYVVGLPESSSVEHLKELICLVDPAPLVGERLIDLARWMSDYYCAPLEKAIRAVLPAAVRRSGARFAERLFVKPVDSQSARGVAGVSGHSDGAGLKLPKKQAEALRILGERGGMFAAELASELGTTVAPVRALEKKGLVSVEAVPAYRCPLSKRAVLRTGPLDLMPEQESALAAIRECIKRTGESCSATCAGASRGAQAESGGPNVVLLYGVTGSGKTEVYLRAIDDTLKAGRGAIVLVPEISLTPQTIERFLARFGDRIAVLHSRLSDGERHDEWHRIREGRADIVIGARSAVFAPVVNLGLIVVDEENEPSYKQEEAPRYSARDVAVMRGRRENCVVVLGSATPGLESWRNALRGKYALARMPRRADNRRMPAVRLVDMRVETERAGHACVFSRELLEAVKARLDRSEQTMLFLNRRGYATSLICPKCGHVSMCDQCSVAHTYHRKGEQLRCHICGAVRSVPRNCPGCGDPAFRFAGIGTQRVEVILQKCFPRARIQRMDSDVTTAKDSHHNILGDFRAGRTDILVGTQMIAKGLHFPNVTLVGVVYADLSLHMPDFRAGERTFQLLAQVAGRAGRGETPGEVIIQTYTPFHAAVQAASRVDYEGFYEYEIKARKEFGYPPFTHLVCVTLKGRSEPKVSYYSGLIRARLWERAPDRGLVSEAGPAPLARAKGMYRYQIIMRSAAVRKMTGALRDVMASVRLPREVSCAVDVDAVSLM